MNEVAYSRNLLDASAYETNVARGIIPGATPFGSFGRRTASGAVTLQVLWPNGPFVLPPSTGVQITFVSTSASDAALGTGARTIDMHYLDTSLNSKVESITLTGLTPVLSVATNVRFIQDIHITTAGSTKAAVGTITASTGATTYSLIVPGDVRCASSARMVPAGKRLLISSIYASSVSQTAAETTVAITSTQYEDHNLTIENIFTPFAQAGFEDNGLTLILSPPLAFTEGACVAMEYTQSGTATVTGGWFGWLEDA